MASLPAFPFPAVGLAVVYRYFVSHNQGRWGSGPTAKAPLIHHPSLVSVPVVVIDASPLQFQSKRLDPLHPDHGLVFRSFIHLFEELKRRSDDATYVIKASYLEIYNEKVGFPVETKVWQFGGK